MNIHYVEYSINTRSLDIFVSGCNPPFCEGCCNPELIDFNNGIPIKDYMNKIITLLNNNDKLIDNIFLLGGSFNHQSDESLELFFKSLLNQKLINKKIWLFAREELDNIKPIFKECCDYIKCGKYIPILSCKDNIQYGIILSTINQVIYKKGLEY